MKVIEDSSDLTIIKQDSLEKLFDSETVTVLEQLEKTQNDYWNVDRLAAEFLYLSAKALGAKNALEIGTSNGYSGIWIAKALKETGGKLTTIEFWDNRLNEARKNFKLCKVDDITDTKLGQAVCILEEMLDSSERSEFDFIFIDANKSEYIKYFELVNPMLKKGGIIIADNINSHYRKVEPYVKTITNSPHYQNILIPIDTGMLYSIKV